MDISSNQSVIKVGIYIDGRELKNKDLLHLTEGNPGMGGTQYCQLLLAYYLNERDGYNVSLISHAPVAIQGNVNDLVIDNFNQLLDKDGDFDIVILNTPRDHESYKFLGKFKKTKFITWSHNYFNSFVAKDIANCESVVLNVFVSKQMYDFYIDHDIILKSTYIFNIVVDSLGECERNPKPNTLVYMGNIVRQKGIIELLKIWQIVEKKVPGATLSIIGGGNLYGDIKIGKFGITDQSTENAMAEYMLDEKGEIKQSIKFLGLMGKEKYNVFLESSVGILNPSAKTETFGLGIIEMATAKLPVVTKNWNAHPDTALNGETALLGYSIKKMANHIIRLFKDENLNRSLGEEGKRQVCRFSPRNIIPLWEEAIEWAKTQCSGSKRDVLPLSKPYWNNYKFLRIMNSKLRFNIHATFLPSIVSMESAANESIKYLRKLKSLIR